MKTKQAISQLNDQRTKIDDIGFDYIIWTRETCLILPRIFPESGQDKINQISEIAYDVPLPGADNDMKAAQLRRGKERAKALLRYYIGELSEHGMEVAPERMDTLEKKENDSQKTEITFWGIKIKLGYRIFLGIIATLLTAFTLLTIGGVIHVEYNNGWKISFSPVSKIAIPTANVETNADPIGLVNAITQDYDKDFIHLIGDSVTTTPTSVIYRFKTPYNHIPGMVEITTKGANKVIECRVELYTGISRDAAIEKTRDFHNILSSRLIGYTSFIKRNELNSNPNIYYLEYFQQDKREFCLNAWGPYDAKGNYYLYVSLKKSS